jgi:hypothetical protein
VAKDGWVARPVKAVSRRRRGPQARLYRACHQPYSATEVDRWQHKLSRVSQNRAAVHVVRSTVVAVPLDRGLVAAAQRGVALTVKATQQNIAEKTSIFIFENPSM